MSNGSGQAVGRQDHKTEGALFGQLREDMSISDGAFRLWHVLKGKSGEKGYCWIGQRRLAKDYQWSIHSLKPWTDQLVAGKYLRVEKPDRQKFPEAPKDHKGVIYVLAISVAQTGHSAVAQTGHGTVAEIGRKPCSKGPSEAVSSTSNPIKNNESSKRTKALNDKCAGAAARENELMRRARKFMGEEGMAKSGGMYRTLIRQNAGKFDRVLAQCELDAREGKDIRNRGGYFMDLWKRFT
jgi:hypothetical protein